MVMQKLMQKLIQYLLFQMIQTPDIMRFIATPHPMVYGNEKYRAPRALYLIPKVIPYISISPGFMRCLFLYYGEKVVEVTKALFVKKTP